LLVDNVRLVSALDVSATFIALHDNLVPVGGDHGGNGDHQQCSEDGDQDVHPEHFACVGTDESEDDIFVSDEVYSIQGDFDGDFFVTYIGVLYKAIKFKNIYIDNIRCKTFDESFIDVLTDSNSESSEFTVDGLVDERLLGDDSSVGGRS
jgi:hypothetical protein